MGLDNVLLSGNTIAALYKNVLVDAKKESGISISSTYKFLGNNQRMITFVVESREAVFIADKHLLFISKLLEACKMNIGDVAIVNHASVPVIIQQIKEELHPQVLILFGVEPTAIRLPFSFPKFKTQAYDGCTYLSVPSLNELDAETTESKLLKSKLWVCLRQLFEV
jgi:hypothetical protein